jgi:hypothetical protein
MRSTCLRLRVDELLERTWVSSNDQAPANASAHTRPHRLLQRLLGRMVNTVGAP